jgi:hypothetical protein
MVKHLVHVIWVFQTLQNSTQSLME